MPLVRTTARVENIAQFEVSTDVSGALTVEFALAGADSLRVPAYNGYGLDAVTFRTSLKISVWFRFKCVFNY